MNQMITHYIWMQGRHYCRHNLYILEIHIVWQHIIAIIFSHWNSILSVDIPLCISPFECKDDVGWWNRTVPFFNIYLREGNILCIYGLTPSHQNEHGFEFFFKKNRTGASRFIPILNCFLSYSLRSFQPNKNSGPIHPPRSNTRWDNYISIFL
jgi:hypothetical protein